MFVIQFHDSEVLVEGSENLACWDDVPIDKQVLSVTLTDGGKVYNTLKGCEFYICLYEGACPVTVSVNSSGAITKMVSKENFPTNQIVYGIRSVVHNKKILNEVVAKVRKDLSRKANEIFDVVQNHVILYRGQKDVFQEVEDNLQELLKAVDDMQVVKMTLGITSENMSLKSFNELKIADKDKRDGVVDMVDADFTKKTEAALTPKVRVKDASKTDKKC